MLICIHLLWKQHAVSSLAGSLATSRWICGYCHFGDIVSLTKSGYDVNVFLMVDNLGMFDRGYSYRQLQTNVLVKLPMNWLFLSVWKINLCIRRCCPLFPGSSSRSVNKLHSYYLYVSE